MGSPAEHLLRELVQAWEEDDDERVADVWREVRAMARTPHPAGYAVVRLPEPTRWLVAWSVDPAGDDPPRWTVPGWGQVSIEHAADGRLLICEQASQLCPPPEMAREVAAALLAAVAHVERATSPAEPEGVDRE